ncbi:FimV family protein [Jeongeupia sp. USM3]|uniref:type IV pilus assembly protein FimV n=1 Tax=Jeongeupia sp. USM3 TaxID=1906741 RepID=UPI00089E01A6|nr:hypothetical protein [Jeongeupia sp. USM3]AOY00355.1 hypothetical protein BJP62_07790 [Jeongeupia sp. USM3]
MNAPLNCRWIALLLGLPLACAQAATLGELQLRSALGERFDAVVPVRLSAGENLGTACFRLLPDADSGIGTLVNARLRYQADDGRGELQIVGTGPVSEPVLQLVVRLQCPDDEQVRFQRSYDVLIDPRDYAAPAVRRSATVDRKARRYPPLGGSWRAADGDTVSLIARHYYPNDRDLRARFIDALHQLNPDLPQGMEAPLPDDARIVLPARPATPGPAPQPVPTVAPLPKLADTLSVTAAEPSQPVLRPAAPAGDGEFRLQLSSPLLDLAHESELTPEERLKLRERLLMLTSDDQTSQLMALKYQVTQLEKQLAGLRQGEQVAVGSDAGQRREPADVSPWWLLTLLLIPLGFVGWRWRARQQDYGDAFSLAHPRASDEMMSMRPATLPPSEPRVRTALGAATLMQNIGQIADEFHNDEVDVVLPGNVSEEAQLLIDHGLVQQAINLLNHEIEQHPAALVLWMKLFEVYRQNDMKQAFQERAVAFRLQFASDALWQQVQAIGQRVDPDNPLYRSLDDSIDRQLELGPAEVVDLGDDALDFASTMYREAGLAPPAGVAAEEPVEAYDAVPVLPSSEELDFQLAPFPEPPDPQVDALIAPALPRAESYRIEPAEFVSDDPQLQQVARHLAQGELEHAYGLLEEALLHGRSMEQRLTAMKWLDKLTPVRGR